jgi:hypothetical protein
MNFMMRLKEQAATHNMAHTSMEGAISIQGQRRERQDHFVQNVRIQSVLNVRKK